MKILLLLVMSLSLFGRELACEDDTQEYHLIIKKQQFILMDKTTKVQIQKDKILNINDELYSYFIDYNSTIIRCFKTKN